MVEAVKKINQKYHLKIDQYDLIELNEAFAVQVLGVCQGLGIDPMKINQWGGAIALGHPLGASGARITTTLLSQMTKNPKAKFGLASMCIGVGQGIGCAFENMN